MTKPKMQEIQCAACGRVVGKKPGVGVTLGIICDDPVCEFQGESSVNETRDAAIVAAALDGTSASLIAAETGVSRQRVYQIVDRWKRGI